MAFIKVIIKKIFGGQERTVKVKKSIIGLFKKPHDLV